jgi:hypothetical protein
LWTAPGTSLAVRVPFRNEWSNSPLMTSVGARLVGRRSVVSVPFSLFLDFSRTFDFVRRMIAIISS